MTILQPNLLLPPELMESQIINFLKNGGIAVIPTDTIYGIVGSALNQKTVERIYKLRIRTSEKPFIILISTLDDLEKFDVKLTKKQREFLEKNWPNPVSVVLQIGAKSLAFRMPKSDNLLKLLKQTGPLVAPSANLEGEKPSETIIEAKKYFGNKVFYKDDGEIKSTPSTLIKLKNDGSYIILRQGNFKPL